MKKIVLLVFFTLLLPLVQISASNIGISIGTFDARPKQGITSGGVQVQTGLVFGIAPRLDLETFLILPVTPEPFSEIIGGLSTSFALMGPVYAVAEEDEVPPYGNVYLSLGFLGNPAVSDMYGPFFKITPISVGGPQFVLRERGASIGIFYNIAASSVTIFWNIFLLDFYL